MTKRILKDENTGLFPNEEAFAKASVMNNLSDAYRISQPPEIVKRLTPEQIHNRANKMATKPKVAERMRELLEAAKISDLDTLGRAFTDLMRFISQAEEKKNFTALAALMRLRLQVIGALKENVLMSVESTISDDELVKRMTEKNPALAAVLRSSIGKENSFNA